MSCSDNVKMAKKEALDAFKIHSSDTGSANAQIAILTARITALANHIEVNKHENSAKRLISSLVSRRKKLIEYLRSHDVKALENILSKLNIRDKILNRI